ncbi:solute carrier family 22 member 12 [Tetranychus urticae]|uniref:solute carrier family 22 member 12 n=1 Tax=Tetranychus urticae TaxID=32264 RepID=UPI00077BE842|nr:solute carrier family 22 member 12 [Tetranychus urticae]
MGENTKESNSLINGKCESKSGQLTLEEVLTKYVGSFGSFQKLLTLYIALFIGPITSMNMISQFLILLIPPHQCDLSTINQTTPLLINSIDSPSPIEPIQLVHQYEGSCSIKRYIDSAPNLTDSLPCPKGWEYDHNLIYPTLVSEQNWVCNERWKALLPHSIYWAGATLGCFVFGTFSDIFGRVPTTMAIFTLAGLSGLAGVFFSHDFTLFVLSRGLMGFAFTGSVTLVLVIEFVGLRNRLLVSTAFVASHSITSALWSAFAYYIANWKLLLILSSSAQFLIPIISIFTPESVRWLYSKGKVEKGSKVLTSVARFNGKQVPEDVLDSIIIRKPAPFHLKEFLNYPRLCRNFMFAGILSILNGISFIGTNLYAAVLLKNPFLVLSLNAFIDAIACLVSKNLADRYGRKRIMLINIYLSFIIYESANLLDRNSIQFMVIFYIGRFTAANTFNILYLYVAEIVPTFFRSRAVSTRLCLNNFGAFIAPFVISLHSYGSYIPLTVIGLTSAVSGLLVLFLPETLGVPLPETCAEADKLGSNQDKK